MVETFKGRKNALPYFIACERTGEKCEVRAYLGNDFVGAEEVGNYCISLIDGKMTVSQLRPVYDLSSIEEKFLEKIWVGRIRVIPEHQEQGVSRELVNGAIETLSGSGRIHMMSFSKEGLERIFPQLLRRGYTAIEPRALRGMFRTIAWRYYPDA